MRRLLLCCGPTRPRGYVRLDSNPKHAPDILAEIPPLPPAVTREPWQVIELIHGIEHFWYWDAPLLVSEIHAALVPGGTMVLEQPNLTAAARVLAGVDPPQHDVMRSAMWPVYGDPAHRDPGYCHRWGYTPETLTDLVESAARWTSVRVLPQQHHLYAAGRDFRLEARR